MHWKLKNEKYIMKPSPEYCTYVISEFRDYRHWHIDMYVQNIRIEIPQFFKTSLRAKKICELIEKEAIKRDY